MSKYLVTGGAGFIGTNLVKKLLADGHEVIVLDDYAGGKKPERLQAGAKYVEGDIRSSSDLDKVCTGVDGIFHMAALPRVTYSVENPILTHDVNVNGTLQVLEAARRHKIKRLVFSSSSSTYGNQPKRQAFKEDSAIKKPISPYALHKFIGENYCRLYAELFGLETVSLVYFNVYGPYFDPDGAYALVVGRFLKQVKNGEPMTVCGDGKYYRDYTHVSDIVRANILSMTTGGVGKGEVINIGNHDPYSVLDIVKLIGGKHVFVPPRPGDGRYFEADITKAKKLLGWKPLIKFPEGIKQLKQDWNLK